MERLGNIKKVIHIDKYKNDKVKYKWQDLGLRILEYIHERRDRSIRARIMRRCKLDYHRAERAFNECKELEKPHARYFFKVFNELKKEYEKI